MSKSNKGWNPYLTGALSGFVSIFSVWLTGHFLGASTTFVRIGGAIENLFMPERVKEMDYFLAFPPQIDWQAMFLIGIFIGSLIAALVSKDFSVKWIPEMWENRFGKNLFKRALVAFCGGVITMFGARLAGG